MASDYWFDRAMFYGEWAGRFDGAICVALSQIKDEGVRARLGKLIEEWMPPPPRAATTNLELPPGKLVVHSPYGPSSWYRVACPAALPTEEKARGMGLALEEYSDQADRGTERHRLTASDIPLEEVPEEHRWAVGRAREYVDQHKGIHHIEVLLRVFSEGKLLTFGTGDHVFIHLETARPAATALDLKHGEGVPDIEALQWQMRSYAVGVWQEFDVKTVTVKVYHVVSGQEWTHTYDVTDLQGLLIGIKERIEYAQAHPEEFNPSPATCRFCRGKGACDAFRTQGNGALIPATPTSLTLAQMRRWDDFWRLMKPAGEAWEKRKKAMTDAELEALGYERKVRVMPRMKSEKTGETYEQVYLKRKNGDE